MKIAALRGELAFAALFAVVGLVWIGGSFELPFWAGFAPDSGFLPLIFGVLLLGLSAAVAVSLLAGSVDKAERREPLTKSAQILGTLVVAVGSIGVLGFVLPLFGLMLFLYVYVERLPLLRSALVAAATTAALALVFEHWLDVPLPLGPWGT